MNQLMQILRFVSVGELREYFEKLRELDPTVFSKLAQHIFQHPPKTYKPYTGLK